MTALTSFAWLLGLFPGLLLCYFALEVALGLVPVRSARLLPANCRTVILIPAHDEEYGIAATIRSLQHIAPPETEILVVADNCSDGTAAAARNAGADVVERHDRSALGKGYALAFGRDTLRADSPDVVIVVDADCRLEAGSIERLATRAFRTQAPAQAVNTLTADPDASPLVRISNFAMVVKNLVRARGLYRMGGGMLLFGTGMAFPWRVFASAPLATADAVEDMRLGLEFARRGIRVHLEEGARVTSGAAGLADSAGQRRRWEHGFLRTARREALPLLAEGIRCRSRHLLALGAHLLVPPLALLVLVAAAALASLTFLAFFSGTWAAAFLLLGAVATAGISVFAAWLTNGRETLGFKALICAPLYVLWKVPIYVGFLTSRQTGWNRTRRENESPADGNQTRS